MLTFAFGIIVIFHLLFFFFFFWGGGGGFLGLGHEGFLDEGFVVRLWGQP